MQPNLFVIFGFSGVGKSTVSQIIAEKIKVKIITTDKIRRLKQFKDQVDHYRATGKFFPKKLRRQFYLKMMAEGKKELQKGRNVIFDATFSAPWTWELAERLSDQLGIKIIPIEVVLEKISDKKITRRLVERKKKDKLAARPEIYWAYKNRYQPYDRNHFVVNNDGTKPQLKRQVLEILSEVL